jgi:IS1 family transposase
VYNNIENKFLFDNTNVGFSFQFFSPLNRKKIAAKLSKYLGKNVIPTKNKKEINFVDEAVFVSPDFEGGQKMNRIDTDLMPYHEAIHTMLKCMNFINESGFTNSKTNINIKVSLNENDLDLKYKLEGLNKFKYILNLNEKKIFEWWPNVASDKQKIYQSKSIFIYPKQLYSSRLTGSLLERANPMEYNFPESSSFGTGFGDLDAGYINIRYAGGKGYQKKKDQAIELINYTSKHLYKTLKNNFTFNEKEKRRIDNLLEKYQYVIDSTKDYTIFKHKYPDIHLHVDLRRDKYLIESNYSSIRNKLFELISCCEMNKAIINYDTARKRIQVKDARISKGFSLSDIDFFNCRVEIDAKDCLFEQCMIRNSNIESSTLYSNNDIKYSKVLYCTYSGYLNEIKSSSIYSKLDLIINADLNNCIVFDGNFSQESKIDEKTELINKSSNI